MTEEEKYKLSPAYLLARIEATELALSITLATLDEKRRNYISSCMDAYAEAMEDEARRKDTDPMRDAASAAWDFHLNLERIVEDRQSEWENFPRP